jgi:hypothetical protein
MDLEVLGHPAIVDVEDVALMLSQALPAPQAAITPIPIQDQTSGTVPKAHQPIAAAKAICT